MVEKEAFLMKPKHQCYLSQLEQYVYGSLLLKERRLLCESVFAQINGQTLILKMVERKVFLMKPKHQHHLSQWGDRVYGTQFWKERRLLCESMFIPIDRQTLIVKMVEKNAFLMKPKHQCHLS